jgi:hypothetical protein
MKASMIAVFTSTVILFGVPFWRPPCRSPGLDPRITLTAWTFSLRTIGLPWSLFAISLPHFQRCLNLAAQDVEELAA